jgi:hypothetical protein
MSPVEKGTMSKTLFDKAFYKTTLCDENKTGMLVMTAPVSHNKLNQNKAFQIVNTILENANQSKNKLTRQNQDFGLDACIIIGYDDDKIKEQPKRN